MLVFVLIILYILGAVITGCFIVEANEGHFGASEIVGVLFWPVLSCMLIFGFVEVVTLSSEKDFGKPIGKITKIESDDNSVTFTAELNKDIE